MNYSKLIMSDEAEKSGQQINLALLESLLGFPVVKTIGHRKMGIDPQNKNARSNKMKGRLLPVLMATGILFLTTAARLASAADTVETWDVGATDVDFYLGHDGIGLEKDEKAVFGDIMLGYGLVERFSAYLGTTLLANEYLSNGSANIYMGIFGTPVETDHFDLDLFLDVSLGGPDLDELGLSPALELNLDLDPQMGSWGTYLRIPFPMQGRKLTSIENAEHKNHEVSFSLGATVGTYYTIAEGHQVLLEYDMGFHIKSIEQEPQIEIGTIAFGYNVTLVDAIELINHFYMDIPQNDESIAFGLMIGFIATLPSGR